MASSQQNNCTLADYVEDAHGIRMQLRVLFDHYYEQQNLGAPMFWIGIYISLASLVCTLAMAVDVIHGIRHKKLWFPCNVFPLNAVSLTLLTVAMKLPMDLTTFMTLRIDQLAKLSSLSFMNTTIGYFMPSLGLMTDKELLANLAALGILVLTVVVNVSIQLYDGAIHYSFLGNMLAVSLMLLLYLLLSFSALSVPTFKETLQLKYHEKHKMVSDEEESERNDGEKFEIGRLTQSVNKYWMMAESSAPQFVMASSVTCAASGAVCFLNAFNLAYCWFIFHRYNNYILPRQLSDYKQSTQGIVRIQTLGVVVGTIGPVFRWVTALNFQGSRKGINSYKNAFKTENYWVKRLADWKERPLSFRIRARKYRRIIQVTKALLLNICIRVQIVIVVTSKLVRLIPIFSIIPFFHCFKLLNEKRCMSKAPESTKEMELSRYVLELEQGEYELPKRILKNMSKAVDKLVQTAKKQQPKNLLELLEKRAAFEVIAELDNEQVPRLLFDEPPMCWSLLVVTLTSIAISLPDIKNEAIDRLLSSVGEGLSYIRCIERTLHNKEDLVKIENATDLLWSRLELYCKWLDEDLHKMSQEGKTPEDNLLKLGDIAESTVMEFEKNKSEGSHKDFLNYLPIKVIAANMMYKTSQMIILKFQANENEVRDDLFEEICIMIAGVISACLTNLPQVITLKCYTSAIEKREGSVKQAARLLGETEEILKLLQQQELPILEPDQAAYLDDWVSIMKQRIASPVITSSESEIIASDELHLVVE